MAPPHDNKRVTIADVAREAGVSRTTVSHALNGLGQVDPRTRGHVRDVAARLNYQPSVRARRLRSGRSQTIALLSSMSSAVSAGASRLGFFTELAMGCAETALTHGYVLALAPPSADTNPLARLDIDGAIVLEPLPDDPLVQALNERQLPYVTIDDATDAANVSLQHETAADLLLGHLQDSGARRIGLVLGHSERASQRTFRQRYLERMAQVHGEPIIATVDETGGEFASYEAAIGLLETHPELDALCVPIDALATGVANAAADMGRTIGQDLLLATRYDGLRARTHDPAMTAINLHLDQVSATAVDLLLNRIKADRVAVTPPALPTPTLIARASTGPH